MTNIRGAPLPEYAELIEKAAAGGVTMVQLREKNATRDEVKAKALFLQKTLAPFKVPLIINDFVDLAAEINADGVHIGQSDSDVQTARKLLGPDKIIGLSIGSVAELHSANNEDGLSYVSAGAVFHTFTKTDYKRLLGVNDLRTLVLESHHPIMAIGGINSTNALSVLNTGVCGIAVVAAIHDSPDPYEAAKELRGIMLERGSMQSNES